MPTTSKLRFGGDVHCSLRPPQSIHREPSPRGDECSSPSLKLGHCTKRCRERRCRNEEVDIYSRRPTQAPTVSRPNGRRPRRRTFGRAQLVEDAVAACPAADLVALRQRVDGAAAWGQGGGDKVGRGRADGWCILASRSWGSVGRRTDISRPRSRRLRSPMRPLRQEASNRGGMGRLSCWRNNGEAQSTHCRRGTAPL